MAERYINAGKDGYLDILREASKRDLNTQDEDGMTATLWAARNGNLEALRLIVGRGGDVDKSDHQGQTALHHASIRGHMGVVSYLVAWGCNVFAMDNELHSALDMAGMHGRQEVVRFLDADLAQRHLKNKKHVARLKEDAMKKAEENAKRHEKRLEVAERKTNKEQKKRNKELDQKRSSAHAHSPTSNGVVNGSPTDTQPKTKTPFFKNFTLRGKKPAAMANGSSTTGKLGGKSMSISPTDQGSRAGTSSRFSDYVGMTSNGTSKKSGIASKIHKKQMESAFKFSEMDPNGQRTVRSLSSEQGFVGSNPGVMYVGSVHGNLGPGKRQPLSADIFNKSNMYRARSEPDILDSGVDSFNGDDDFENNDDDRPGIFNRPEFGKLAFFQKKPFLETLQSLDDAKSPEQPTDSDDLSPDSKRLSGDGEEGDQSSMFSEKSRNSSEFSKTLKRFTPDQHPSSQLPWDQDDVGNLDDDDDDNKDGEELSAVNMFLWSCGLPGYLHIFSQEKIDLPLIMRMTDTEMKELGLPFGPRKKLREAVAKRQAVLDAPPKSLKDSYL